MKTTLDREVLRLNVHGNKQRRGKRHHGALSALLAYCGIEPQVELALIKRFGTVQKVLSAPMEELCAVNGMTENAAILIGLTAELRRRVNPKAKLPNFKASAAESGRIFENSRSEEAFALLVNKRGNGKKLLELGSGGIAFSSVAIDDVIDIMKPTNGDRAIMVHNHINAATAPSLDDIGTTKATAAQFENGGLTLDKHLLVYGGEGNPVLCVGDEQKGRDDKI